MIKYTTKDIVNKARSIADVEDSAFFSDTEVIMFINDAYHQLYQKLINRNDTSFVKTIEHISKGTYKLPNDFYSLKSITTKDGTAIIRKGANDSANSSRYEITNGNLVIEGAANDITVKYWPKPATLPQL